MKLKFTAILAGVFLALFLAGTCPAQTAEGGDTGEKVRSNVFESVQTRKQTQKEREQWQEEKQELTAAYDRLQDKKTRLEKERALLEKKKAAAEKRIAGKEKKLADIEQITEDIEPFILQTADRLEEVVENDLPFLAAEREKRLDRIGELMADPGKSVSEKYRRVMEALLVEAEYGNTIEAYQKSIEVDGRSLRANIFRLGRISLFYQTMDQEECGWFNAAENRWEKLPATHNSNIAAAIDIAAQRQPAELLTLPLGRMVVK
ncbi:vacuolar-type H+-ATPase subunit I/STV1 [Desulfosalsimonas propionicica]|uniref:Vacuolar-type H+-ATPase subunit I/STV1 n=1 Tax=Desulfosalsimonas propionicica TaxID=332175 RepID=A0A7W0HLD4_9BACT|nr:DUF3450 domain-containing protein [Desulfosalsimonas propionicica]MBA2882197.1 vacuolar-type H+-ATPase subunit I/STV1 [Desulfosalsimonas propionicica]